MDLLNPPRLDKRFVKKSFNRAAKSYDSTAILQEEVLNRLLQRLPYIRHQPQMVADLGCGTGKGIAGLARHYPRARIIGLDIAEQMLFAAQSFDLVFSSLALQWCNDLRGTLAEFARVSRPGALLMFASFGPGTLGELAAAWQALESRPHVHRFVDMHDVGDAMLAAGFEQPVVDAEVIRVEYGELRGLLDDLSIAGARNADIDRRRGLTTPRELARLEASYRRHGMRDGKFVASYEVVYGHAWCR